MKLYVLSCYVYHQFIQEIDIGQQSWLLTTYAPCIKIETNPFNGSRDFCEENLSIIRYSELKFVFVCKNMSPHWIHLQNPSCPKNSFIKFYGEAAEKLH